MKAQHSRMALAATTLAGAMVLTTVIPAVAVSKFDNVETHCGWFGANEIWISGTTQGHRNHRIYQGDFVALKELPYRGNLTNYKHYAGTELFYNWGTGASAYGSINATYVNLYCN